MEKKMTLKLMPGMTLQQQIAGTRRAIQSLQAASKGPIWLLPSLKKRLRQLIEEKKRRDTVKKKAGRLWL